MAELTAAQRVLAMPELLSQIFSWIAQDWQCYVPILSQVDTDDEPGTPDSSHKRYSNMGVLTLCARVNSLWWAEASRHIWEDVRYLFFSDPACELVKGMREATPERRQLYANHVQIVSTGGRTKEHKDEVNKVLEGVVFPCLKEMTLFLSYDQVHMPRIQAPNLVKLDIDPSFDINPDTYRFYLDDWDVLLPQIVVSVIKTCKTTLTKQELYPTLEEVNIIDYTLVNAGTLDKFKEQMPHLQRTDFTHAKLWDANERRIVA